MLRTTYTITPDGIAVLELAGNIATDENVSSFRETVEKLIAAPIVRVVILDLREVAYIDDLGSAALTQISLHACDTGTCLALAAPAPNLRPILREFVERGLVAVYSSLEEAEESMEELFPFT